MEWSQTRTDTVLVLIAAAAAVNLGIWLCCVSLVWPTDQCNELFMIYMLRWLHWCIHMCRPSHLSEDNELLMKRFPTPLGSPFRISPVLLESTFTAANYRARMHDLLYVEEIAQYANISRSALSVFVTNDISLQSIFLCAFLWIFVAFWLYDWTELKHRKIVNWTRVLMCKFCWLVVYRFHISWFNGKLVILSIEWSYIWAS